MRTFPTMMKPPILGIIMQMLTMLRLTTVLLLLVSKIILVLLERPKTQTLMGSAQILRIPHKTTQLNRTMKVKLLVVYKPTLIKSVEWMLTLTWMPKITRPMYMMVIYKKIKNMMLLLVLISTLVKLEILMSISLCTRKKTKPKTSKRQVVVQAVMLLPEPRWLSVVL